MYCDTDDNSDCTYIYTTYQTTQTLYQMVLSIFQMLSLSKQSNCYCHIIIEYIVGDLSEEAYTYCSSIGQEYSKQAQCYLKREFDENNEDQDETIIALMPNDHSKQTHLN